MKTKTAKEQDTPISVYRELADRIKTQTEGVDYDNGEVETTKNGLIYWCNYTVERVSFERSYPDYDVQPDTDEKIYCDIIDWSVFDGEGNPTSMTMNPDEIRKYFDCRPDYCDMD